MSYLWDSNRKTMYHFPLVAWCLVSLFYTVRSQGDPRRSRPFFTPTRTNVTYSVGDTATLNCGVRDRGSKTITWRRLQEVSPLTFGTETYTRDGRISSTHNKFKHQWNLHIDNVQMKDMGVYECQVSTKQAMAKHFFLNILERQLRDIPKPGVVVTGTDILEVGQPLSLTCNATGKTDTPRDVEWFKESERVQSNSRTLVAISKSVSEKQRSLVSYLVVKRSRISDSGTYLCRSSDKETGTISVHVLNAATFNVKRGTEKNEKPRGSVKKQLQPKGNNNGYYNIPNTEDGQTTKQQGSKSQQSKQPADKGSASQLSPFTFQTFVTILIILLRCN